MKYSEGHQRSFLFIVLILLVFGVQPSYPDEAQSFRKGWLIKALNIPSPQAPWKFNYTVENYFFSLDMPREIELFNSLPPQTREKFLQKFKYRQKNIEILQRAARDVEKLLATKKFHSPMEYDSEMNTVVLSVHQSEERLGNPLFRHEAILKNLPDYTKIYIFAPQNLVAPVRQQVDALNLGKRTQVFPVALWEKEEGGIKLMHTNTRWVRDLLETAVDAQGMKYIFTPVASRQIDDLNRSDVDFLKKMETADQRVIRLPLFFYGGNILLGTSKRGESVMFFGEDDLEYNRTYFYNAIFSYPSDEGYILTLKALTGADKYYVLPNDSSLFHLDTVMVFLDKGVVGVIDPLDRQVLNQDDKALLENARRVLKKAGFKIVFIPTLTKRMASFLSPVNVLPFTNKRDHKRYVFVPEYPDATVLVNGKQQSLNKMIIKAYESSGYVVISIPDHLAEEHGSLHCAFMNLD